MLQLGAVELLAGQKVQVICLIALPHCGPLKVPRLHVSVGYGERATRRRRPCRLLFGAAWRQSTRNRLVAMPQSCTAANAPLSLSRNLMRLQCFEPSLMSHSCRKTSCMLCDYGAKRFYFDERAWITMRSARQRPREGAASGRSGANNPPNYANS